MKKRWSWKQKLKKGLIISCLFVGSLIMLPTSGFAATKLSVENNSLNVRSGPGTAHSIVAKVHKGEQFNALDTRGDWYKIKVNGVEGWIAGWLVQAKKVDGISPSVQPADKVKQATVTATSLNVREGPGMSYGIVTKVNKGEKYTIAETKDQWLKIKLSGGNSGWVAAQLVTVNEVAVANPTVPVQDNTTGQTEQQPNSTDKVKQATVTAATLNVREGPGMSYGIVTKVNKGEKYTIAETKDQWLKIKLSGGNSGWVAAQLVTVNEVAVANPTVPVQDNTTGQAEQQPNSTDKIKQATVTAATLNVREGSGMSYGIVTKVNKGEKYTIAETKDQWLKIKLSGGNSGWVAAQLVTVNEVAVANPTVPVQDNTTGQAEQQPNNTDKTKLATVTAASLDVREGPGTAYGVVAKVDKGEQYIITNINGYWLEISLTDDKVGWIPAWLVNVNEAAVAKPDPLSEDNSQVDSDNGVSVVVNDSSVKVRGGPGTQHRVISNVSRGQRLGVLERAGDWYKVKLDGGVIGWVSDWMIIDQAEASPAAEDPPVETPDTDQSDELEPGELVKLDEIKIEEKNDHTLVSIKANGPLNYDMRMMLNPERLVIDLKNISLGDMPEKAEVDSKAVSQMRTGWFSIEPPVVRVVFDLKDAVVYVDKISEDRTQLNLDIYIPEIGGYLQGRTIALDPGHGGSEPGGIGSTGVMEKDIALDITLKLAQILKEKGANVILTRSDDSNVDLWERTAIAERNGAEVFLSVHCNGSDTNPNANGTSTYYRRDYDGGYEDYVQGVSQEENRKLAGAIQSEMLRVVGRRSLGVLQSNFVVVRTATMPAALAETAFLSNWEEEQLLKQEATCTRFAEALAEGLNNYFAPTD